MGQGNGQLEITIERPYKPATWTNSPYSLATTTTNKSSSSIIHVQFFIPSDTQIKKYLGGNGDLNIHTGLNVDRGDLLDNLGGGVEIDESLVDSHLKVVPGLGTLTVGGLSGGDVEHLGGESDGALDANVGVLGSRDDVSGDCVSKCLCLCLLLARFGALKELQTAIDLAMVEVCRV